MNTKKIRFISELRKISGLEDENITSDHDVLGLWKYAGGGEGSYLTFYEGLIPRPPKPEHKDNCLCGTDIIRQRFIQHKETGKLIVVGSECIEEFICKIRRTCQYRIEGEVCGENTKGHKYMICKECEPLAIAEYKKNKFTFDYTPDVLNEYQKTLYEIIGDRIELEEQAKEDKKLKKQLTKELNKYSEMTSEISKYKVSEIQTRIELIDEKDPEKIVELKELILQHQMQYDLNTLFTKGKYKYQKYGWILKHDKNYANWARTIDDKMYDLYDYIYD